MTARSDQRKRLLFFFSGTGQFRYGVAEVFRHVLNGLDKERYQPVLVITGALDEPIKRLSDSVELVELRQQGLRKAFVPLVRAIRRIRPDIMVSAMEHPNALAVLARMVSRHRCKLVLTSHNVFTPRLQFMWAKKEGHMIRRMVRWTYPLADHIVCVSDAVKSDLSRHVPRLGASSVIHNPVLDSGDLPEPDFENRAKGMIVTSSRLASYKRVDEAIRALEFLDDHFYLVILGDGPGRSRLEELVTALGLEERVKFAGYVEDPFAWYRKAEIFVLPSMWEGFGNVLIESMACGCQVVANADAWGPPEVLGYGEYGFLYQGGVPRDLAAVINDASDNPKPRVSLIQYARQFTDQQCAKKYELIFESEMN